MSTKLTFEDIFFLLQKQDARNGTFFIAKFNLGFKHIFARLLLFAGLVLEFFFSTSAFFGNDLLLFILESIVVVLYITFVSSVVILKIKSSDTQVLFNFCYEIYEIEKVFHKRIQDIARKHVKIAHERSKFLLKWIVIIFYFDPILVVPIFGTIKYLLPDRISPKYSLPIPFNFMFFKDQETPQAFYFTVTAQTICSLQISIGAALLYSIVSAVIIHVFAYLDIISDVIEMMNQDLRKHYVGLGVKRTNKDGTSLSTEFDMAFWIKLIVEMVSKLHDTMSSFGNVFGGFLLLSEMTGFASFIALGMVFLVLQKQHLLGIGICVASVLFFCLCYVNEQIVTKLTKIRFDLYNIDWWNLDAKEMQLLFVPLNVDKLGISFSASGIHDLTLDRFASVAKGAYSNCLVLKDILTK